MKRNIPTNKQRRALEDRIMNDWEQIELHRPTPEAYARDASHHLGCCFTAPNVKTASDVIDRKWPQAVEAALDIASKIDPRIEMMRELYGLIGRFLKAEAHPDATKTATDQGNSCDGKTR